MPDPIQDISQSWGRLATSYHSSVLPYSRSDIPAIFTSRQKFLGFGLGRSYGDSCLNSGGVLIQNRGLNKLIAFDRENGVISCESGTSLAELLEVIVPAGWFLPVTPGTKFVTVGGAIANDVHGKNHHVHGTFGQHVRALELIRSTGETLLCGPDQNIDMFRATIGGLGLTGFVSWASIQLIPIVSPLIYQESIKFGNIDEFFAISEESDQSFEYTVAWVDCMSKNPGRGIFFRGRHDLEPAPEALHQAEILPAIVPIPVNAPRWLLNSMTMKAFNELYYRKQRLQQSKAKVHFDPFFYPLDRIHHWNRLYGSRGFFQYQFVLPLSETNALRHVFATIRHSGQGTSLAVFKRFAAIPSPGLLSFPQPGYTLALDFANRGRKTSHLFDQLDQIVFDAKGRIYPAKDACMSALQFKQSYPQFQEFLQYIDPNFSSDFWLRVTS